MNKFQVSPDLPPSARSNITDKCTVQCTVRGVYSAGRYSTAVLFTVDRSSVTD